MKYIFIIFSFLITIFLFTLSFLAFKEKNENQSLKINLHHFVGNEVLKIDSGLYYNNLNQNFTVTNFMYYLGEIKLTDENNVETKINQYFLVNELEEKSKQIFLENIPKKKYKKMSFIVGVDSLRNCSGAQSGALDPINTMFWTWNSGYIFLKLEGKSSASKIPGNFIEYHVGGYKLPYNNIKKIELKFPESLEESVNIKVDILEIFKNPNDINFSSNANAADAKSTVIIANNYADMFSIMK